MNLLKYHKLSMDLQDIRAFVETTQVIINQKYRTEEAQWQDDVVIRPLNVRYRNQLIETVATLLMEVGWADPLELIKDEGANFERQLSQERERKLLDEIESLKGQVNLRQTDVNQVRSVFQRRIEAVCKMLVTIRETDVTHAERRGQLIMLEHDLRALSWLDPVADDIPF